MELQTNNLQLQTSSKPKLNSSQIIWPLRQEIHDTKLKQVFSNGTHMDLDQYPLNPDFGSCILHVIIWKIFKLGWLVVFVHPCEKYDFVNWDDHLPFIYGKIKNGNKY